MITALCADDGRRLAALEAELRGDERLQAHAYSGRRRRQFVLGRLAAHAAIDRFGTGAEDLWIAADASGAPTVRSGNSGVDVGIGVGIAHSRMLAIACAWRMDARRPRRVGIDVERLRRTDVGSSGYAFSRREQRLLRATGVEWSRAGLLAWVAKEAAWKAVRFSEEVGPDAVEVRRFNPDAGRATALVRRTRLAALDRSAAFHIRLRALAGPDGEYLMAIAEEKARQ